MEQKTSARERGSRDQAIAVVLHETEAGALWAVLAPGHVDRGAWLAAARRDDRAAPQLAGIEELLERPLTAADVGYHWMRHGIDEPGRLYWCDADAPGAAAVTGIAADAIEAACKAIGARRGPAPVLYP